MQFTDLPEEMLLEIFLFLTGSTMFNLNLVCKRFSWLVNWLPLHYPANFSEQQFNIFFLEKFVKNGNQDGTISINCIDDMLSKKISFTSRCIFEAYKFSKTERNKPEDLNLLASMLDSLSEINSGFAIFLLGLIAKKKGTDFILFDKCFAAYKTARTINLNCYWMDYFNKIDLVFAFYVFGDDLLKWIMERKVNISVAEVNTLVGRCCINKEVADAKTA